MTRCAPNNSAPRTVNQVALTASAANIVQIDCASASTKMGISESYGICRGSIDIDVDSCSREPTLAGTPFLICRCVI